MWDAKARGHRAGIMDIDPGTAGSLRLNGDTMIIELQGDADDLIALLMQEGCRHRTVDTARHGNNDTCLSLRLGKAERITGR
jgi:hypothetical protein